MLYAHSRNDQGQRQGLEEHLLAVADLAARYAQPFGLDELAGWLGRWHDLGKAHPDWQRYLLASEAGQRAGRSPGHSAAGALLAVDRGAGALALTLQGHHGGLHALTELRALAADAAERRRQAEALRALAAHAPPAGPNAWRLPPALQTDRLAAEFVIRMMLSCLVDADYTDTARFYGETGRAEPPDLATLWQRYLAHQERLSGRADDVVARTRHAVYQQCLQAADLPPGLFRLSVPTGGGKTLSSLGFALKHALAHGLQRIIIAIPYLAITEQTVARLRAVLERPGEPPAVLEHHSAVQLADDEDEEGQARQHWLRLAAETWDAPIIVTTTVQLFESLFANRPTRVRKLHRLADSIIVLDEAQALPPASLQPILDALGQLVKHYHCSVVLSTATQPAFAAIAAFGQLDAREIVTEPQRHYQALQRVRYELCPKPQTWAQLAEQLLSVEQAMAIVNTKADAQALFAALGAFDPTALHLSAALCGAHRRQVLAEVERRLAAGEPCRLVATQVVEAGVDLDFPLVLRALGPLDSIIQAAGRCNREGRLASGRVLVFEPAEGHLPPGVYRTATNLARVQLAAGAPALEDPEAISHYFRQLYATTDLDAHRVQDSRRELDYPETARRFRLIDEPTVSVLVPYGDAEQRDQVDRALGQLAQGWGSPREALRALQPYLVSLPAGQVARYVARGWLSEVLEGIYVWGGRYDPHCGLLPEERSPEDSVC